MSNGRLRINGVVIGLLLLAAAIHAQPPFEASVKLNPDDVPESISLQPTGFRFTGFRVRTLIAMTYGPGTFDQLIGGPPWIATERFDIVAKTDQRIVAGPSGRRPELVPTILKAVLEERFKLKVHSEQREMPVYALRLARADGRLGPQIKPTTIDCPPLLLGVPSEPADPARWCGIRSVAGSVTGQHVGMGGLAGWLAGLPVVQRPVVDRTDLGGFYDLHFEIEADGASVFTVLREQLGVTLQSERTPMPVVVIDRVEHPTPD